MKAQKKKVSWGFLDDSKRIMFQKKLWSLLVTFISTLASIYLWKNGLLMMSVSKPNLSHVSGLIGSIRWLFRGIFDRENESIYSTVVRSELMQALNLLRIGDSWGAEVICQTLSKNILSDSSVSTFQEYLTVQETSLGKRYKSAPSLIDTLVCLGEARLTLHRQLHDSLWSRFHSQNPNVEVLETLLHKQLDSSIGKLNAARESFETVVFMDPMNPRARSDLGLTLMLLATRSLGPFQFKDIGEDDFNSNRENSDLDMLFDATLHLNAAVTLIDSRRDGLINDPTPAAPIFHAMDKTMYVSTLYNSALAHLAIGDYLNSIRLLKRVHDLLKFEDPYASYKMVSIPLVNVVGVLIQLGQINEALTLLLEMDIVEYCSSQAALPTTVDRVIARNRRPQENRLLKLCVIVMNNHDLAMELKSYSNIDMDLPYNNSLLGSGLYEISSELNKIFIKSDDVTDTLEFSKINRDYYRNSKSNGDEENQQSLDIATSAHEQVPSPKLYVTHALNSIQKAAYADPYNARIWLSLTRAKLVAGDFVGAVEAATQAVNVASSLEEIEAASRSLESALERFSGAEKSVELISPDETEQKSKSHNDHDEFQSLRLERDILSLKLQLLQQESATTKPETPNVQEISLSQVSNSQGKDISSFESPSINNLPKGDILADEELMIDMVTSSYENFGNETSNINIPLNIPVEIPVVDLVDSTFDSKIEIDSITSESNIIIADEIVQNTDKGKKELELPILFQPDLALTPTDISPTALSYMKIADAHMAKSQFQQAAKQFSKVLKRHHDHLPALLGYATAFERSSSPNQLEEVSIAYLHAAQVALIRGAKELADAVMQRALDVSLQVSNQKRLGVLKQLFNYSHTDILAAEISYEMGRLSKQNNNLVDARHSFQLANALIEREVGNSSAYHARSNLELGKIALENDSDYNAAISFAEQALLADIGKDRVLGLVILGRSKALAGDLVAAKAAYLEAIDLPSTEYSAQAHYHLGILLMNSDGDNELVEKHFIHALNLGMDASEEMVNILGEYHIAVLKSINRAKRREYENAPEPHSRTSGVLGGASISDKSIFKKAEEGVTPKSDTLSILEQGAASYDGQTLPGGEDIDDSLSPSLRNTRKSQSATH